MDKKGKYVYDWPRPTVSVDAVVFAFFNSPRRRSPTGRGEAGGGQAKLLLIKRGQEPFKGKWALPGGFVGIDEELEDAVTRELAEETGLVNVPLKQMHTFGRCGRDPRGRQITIAFMGIAAAGKTRVKGGDDAAEARWFDTENIPRNLGFDHNEIATFAIRTLKREKSYL